MIGRVGFPETQTCFASGPVRVLTNFVDKQNAYGPLCCHFLFAALARLFRICPLNSSTVSQVLRMFNIFDVSPGHKLFLFLYANTLKFRQLRVIFVELRLILVLVTKGSAVHVFEKCLCMVCDFVS